MQKGILISVMFKFSDGEVSFKFSDGEVSYAPCAEDNKKHGYRYIVNLWSSSGRWMNSYFVSHHPTEQNALRLLQQQLYKNKPSCQSEPND